MVKYSVFFIHLTICNPPSRPIDNQFNISIHHTQHELPPNLWNFRNVCQCDSFQGAFSNCGVKLHSIVV